MAFAGIYELWRDAALPDDHPAARLWTAAIITTSATDDVGWVHDRMPMVVSPGHWDEWLDPAAGDADSLLTGDHPRRVRWPGDPAGIDRRQLGGQRRAGAYHLRWPPRATGSVAAGREA